MRSVTDYARLTAVALLAVTYLAALGIAVDIYVVQGAGATLPNVVTLVIGSGLGVALHMLGIQTGELTRASN